jgi:hypothetical protein
MTSNQQGLIMKIHLSPVTAKKLQELLGSTLYEFLGFTVNLEIGDITDNLAQIGAKLNDWTIEALSTLLTHYSSATLTSPSGKLVKYKDLPGGCAYEGAFVKTAILPIADVFGENPLELIEAAAKLGGKPLGYGDASAETTALKGIPLVFIVWEKEEYPAAASILYDQTASNYLPTEDLAVLGEIAASRLIQAKNRRE